MQLKGLAPGLSFAALTAAASLMAAAPARAQENAAPAVSAPPAAAASPSGFGDKGAWAFTFQTADSGSGYFLFHKTSGGGSTFELNPGVDYFLAPNISLGGSITFNYDSGQGNSYGVGLRAGYYLNVNRVPNVGFWPMARFFVTHTPQTTNTSFSVLAPFLWHPAAHFFLGAGPSLEIGLSGLTYTQYGIDFMLGGWI